MSDVLQNVLTDEKLIEAAQRVAAGQTVQLGGVWGSSGPLVAAAMGRLAKRSVLFVTPHLDGADGVVTSIKIHEGSTSTGGPYDLWIAPEVGGSNPSRRASEITAQ